IQPVIFVLLFRYVFGGVVSTSLTVPYVDYLMPGVFVQTVVFGAIGTAVGLATDVKSGLLHRVAVALERSGVDIRSARASALGGSVRDAFYVATQAGAPIPKTPAPRHRGRFGLGVTV